MFSLKKTIALLTLFMLLQIEAYATPRYPAPMIDGFTSFVYPVMAPKLSSVFGKRKHPIRKVIRHHDGLDLAAPTGADIRSVAEGYVVFADSYGSYGLLVVVRHQNGMTTHYGHCSQIRAKTGQFVKAGQIIGKVGETGGATGPHLHFEIRKNGKPLDPKLLVPDIAAQAEG